MPLGQLHIGEPQQRTSQKLPAHEFIAEALPEMWRDGRPLIYGGAQQSVEFRRGEWPERPQVVERSL